MISDAVIFGHAVLISPWMPFNSFLNDVVHIITVRGFVLQFTLLLKVWSSDWHWIEDICSSLQCIRICDGKISCSMSGLVQWLHLDEHWENTVLFNCIFKWFDLSFTFIVIYYFYVFYLWLPLSQQGCRLKGQFGFGIQTSALETGNSFKIHFYWIKIGKFVLHMNGK